MKRISFIILLFVFLSECSGTSNASYQELEHSAETYVGQTTDDLIQEKGPPGSVAILPSGDSVWTYKSLKKDLKRSSDSPVDVSGQKRSIDSRIKAIVFLIDNNGRIKSYSASMD